MAEITYELSDEQRADGLRAAIAARHHVAQVRTGLASGELTVADVLADPRAVRMRVVTMLTALPRIGKVKAAEIMRKCGISEHRRVGGLGCRQRERLMDAIGDVHFMAFYDEKNKRSILD